MGRQDEKIDPGTESIKSDTLTIRVNGNVKKWVSIVGAIIAIFISLYPYVNSYFHTKAMIESHQNEICDLKKTVQELINRSQNNKDEILKLTQQSQYISKAIDEINADLKEIKKLLISR